jgi:hypothetical protein
MAGTHRRRGAHGRGRETRASAAVAGAETGIHLRGAGVHVELDLIGLRSMSVIKTVLLTVRSPIGLKRELLAPPRLTGWTSINIKSIPVHRLHSPIFLSTYL